MIALEIEKKNKKGKLYSRNEKVDRQRQHERYILVLRHGSLPDSINGRQKNGFVTAICFEHVKINLEICHCGLDSFLSKQLLNKRKKKQKKQNKKNKTMAQEEKNKNKTKEQEHEAM